MKTLVRVSLLALIALGARAMDYYVAETGNDTTGDGSAANPYATIAKAVAKASPSGGDTVRVAAGTYPITAQINVEKPVSIIGDGWRTTTVRMTGGDGTKRILYMSNDVAVVSGLTLTGSAYGRNGYPAGFAGGGGAAAFVAGGTLADCRITGNNISYGNANGFNGAAVNVRGANAVVSRCIIDHNTRARNTAGGCGLRIDCGLAENCLIYANTGSRGAGVYMAGSDSHLRNCTVAANLIAHTGNNDADFQGGGLYSDISAGSTIVNCVFADNASHKQTAGDGGAEWYAKDKAVLTAAMSHCAVLNDGATGAIGAGAVQLATSPFVDVANEDFRLTVASPAIDAGTTVGLDATDIDGNARAFNAPDIGCYELQYGDLTAGLAPLDASAFANAPIAFTPTVRGTNGTDALAFAWSLENAATGDGVALGAAASAETLALPGGLPAGRYTVGLSVRNATQGGSWIAAAETGALFVNARTNYVTAAANPDAAFPWDSPATAATSIQQVLDAALNGSVVLLAEGTYPIREELLVEKGVTLLGAGRDRTKIVNTATSTSTNRVLYLGHPDAYVGRLTLEDGIFSSGTVHDRSTAGAWGAFIQAGTLADACVTNCSTSYGNATMFNGAAVEVASTDARVTRTIICCNKRNSNNTAKGGGLRIDAGLADDCLVYGNTGGYGAGVYIGANGAKLRNCTVVGNTCNGSDAKYQGAGLYFEPTAKGAEIVNCVFAYNVKTTGATSGNGGSEWYAANQSILTSAVKNCAFLSDASTGSATAVGTDSFTFLATDRAFCAYAKGNYMPHRKGVLRDKGLYADWMASARDIDGRPRLLGPRVDIGCYECDLPLPLLLEVK